MHPFKIKLLIQRRPHMLDENLEYLLHIGTKVLRLIFDDECVDKTVTSLKMYYTERWMNIVEERSLYNRLQYFCPNLKDLEIMTQSVYLIQMTEKSSYLIVQSTDEQENVLNQDIKYIDT
jgi:hypothetical protein